MLPESRAMSSKSPKRGTAPQSKISQAEQARKRRNIIIASVVGLAVVAVAAVLIAGGGGDDSKSTASSGGTVAGLAETNELLKGIPQQAGELGEKDAPITLIEFADLQCPFCRQFALTTYPVIVNKYVATGKLRVEFRTLTFIGPDSEKAARAAAAAGQQKRESYFTQLWYFNQGQENSGYATDAFIEKIWKAAGVDVRPGAEVRRQPGVDGARRRGPEGRREVRRREHADVPDRRDRQAADEVRRGSRGRGRVQGRDRRAAEALTGRAHGT